MSQAAQALKAEADAVAAGAVVHCPNKELTSLDADHVLSVGGFTLSDDPAAVRCLHLDHNALTDAGVQADLRRFTALVRLSLSHNRLALDFGGCPPRPPRPLPALSHAPPALPAQPPSRRTTTDGPPGTD